MKTKGGRKIKWEVAVFVILLVNMSFLRVGSEENSDLVQYRYEVVRKGVQDFSDGKIVMVENPVEVVVDEEFCSVTGVYYNCLIKGELSEDFLTFSVGDASIVYDIPGEQPFGKLYEVEGVYEEKNSGEEGHKLKQVIYKRIFEGMDLRYTFLDYKVLEEVVLEKFRNVQVIEQDCIS